MDGSHWIGSIAFELRAPDAKALDPFRRALRSDHDHLLRGSLQRALDGADRPGAIVRHRRIEVDLGSLGPDDWGDQLARRIADGIARSMADAGPVAGSPSEPAASEAELLLSFLRTGTLPWPSSGEALGAICLALAEQDEVSFERLAARLQALFAARPETATRFVRQCPARLVLRIAAALGSLREPFVRGGKPAARFIREPVASALAPILVRLAGGDELADPIWHWLEAVIASGSAGTFEPLPLEAPVTAPDAPQPAGAGLADAEPGDGERQRAEDDSRPDKAIAAGLPLGAAGAILLHPFLSGLFQAVGLLDEHGAFLTEDHRARAVLLLNYAATGEAEQPEPELLLAKLLSGMEFQAPVARSIEPSELERSEVDSLLGAAIAHWGALGDTSPEALRETFLKRAGRLQRDGEDWRLIVEQRGVDVLLDRLPWAISLVKTPFMARPLRVDWR